MPAELAMIDAIVLAAGRSLRMGTQKLLLPFAGQTVIGHVVDQVLAAHIRKLFVVVSAADSPIAAALVGKPLAVVENPDPSSEMLDSIRCGLRALPLSAAATVIVLGDQPALRPEVIAQIVAAFQTTGRGIVAPAYGGRLGHPLLVAERHFAELLARHDDGGLRGLLAAHPDDVHALTVGDDAVLSDMDLPEDYRRELARLNKPH